MKTEKLELRHLAPYLPYGLRYYIFKDPAFLSKYLESCPNGEWCPVVTLENISEKIFKDNYKPILRPLSDLTKEIEVNGERFVPMQQLYEMAYIHILDKIYNPYTVELCDYDDYETHGLVAREETGERNGFTLNVGSNKFQFDMSLNNEVNNGRYHINQMELINKLYEWKFDVFGLIESGLAIDATTLDNPYK